MAGLGGSPFHWGYFHPKSAVILMAVPIQAGLENLTAEPSIAHLLSRQMDLQWLLKPITGKGTFLGPLQSHFGPPFALRGCMEVIWKQKLGAGGLTFSCTLHGWAFTTFLIKCVH